MAARDSMSGTASKRNELGHGLIARRKLIRNAGSFPAYNGITIRAAFCLFFAPVLISLAQPARCSYILTAYNCAQTICSPPFQEHRGTWSKNSDDRVVAESGVPFRIDGAAGATFYGKSIASIQGNPLSISNHIQLANFHKWTIQSQGRPKGEYGPANAAVNALDRLTVTGAEGSAYLLPIYEIQGSFASAGEKFLDSWIAVCPGINGCVPKAWHSSPGGPNLYRSYQPPQHRSLQFEFGKPFEYFTDIYSRLLPQQATEATTLPDTFVQEETVDFTVRLVGVSITDRQGKEIPGAQVTSESGLLYKVLRPLAQ
jgi:hypothetical protein